MKKYILTVGPSLLIETPLNKVHSERNIYRINGAHGSIEDVEDYIERIRTQIPSANILIDLPGNKIRTENLEAPVKVTTGEVFSLKKEQFNYSDFYKQLSIGDEVWADDSTLHFNVKSIDGNEITFFSHSDGFLKKNKGFNVRGISDKLPFLFDRDYRLIDIANKHKISHIGLSFVRSAEDISVAKQHIAPSITIISKVETKSAVKNLNEILSCVEYILVDRGDLSSEVGIEKIARYQSYIIDKALFYNKKIFLATQFLKNMEERPIPTIAEMIDLHRTFSCGILGIQLSEETSIGKYPVKCVEILNKVIHELNSSFIHTENNE